MYKIPFLFLGDSRSGHSDSWNSSQIFELFLTNMTKHDIIPLLPHDLSSDCLTKILLLTLCHSS